MSSRRLTTLLEQWKKEETPTLLIQILSQAFNDEEYQLVSDMIDGFKGTLTPEMRYLAGESLAKLDKKESSIEHLLVVLESNPNHFKAKQLLEELGYQEEKEENVSDKKAIESFKDILLPTTPIHETASYRSNKRKYLFAVTILIVIAATLVITLFWQKNKDFFIDIENPVETLYPLAWSDYQVKMANIKRWVSRHKASENSRTASFYLSAYTIIDNYLITTDRELLSKVRFYFALTQTKTREMKRLNSYIENRTAPDGIEYLNMLECNYPQTKADIMQQKVEPIAIISHANLREALYATLILLRQEHLTQAHNLVTKILAVYPRNEIAEKLFVLIQAYSLKKNSSYIINKDSLLQTLTRLKIESPERHLLSEAWMAIGKSTNDLAMIEEGFYLGCPHSYWCDNTIRYFLAKKEVTLARRMAEYMKSKRGLNRKASDIQLVLETAFAEDDFGSCYFSYKELKQFFPNSINYEIAKIAAICSENNGYYEEAEELYLIVEKAQPSPEAEAKIEEMRWLVHEDEDSFNHLKKLHKKNPENIKILRSYLTVVIKGNDIREAISLLDILFNKIDSSKQQAIIDQYVTIGAISHALKKLKGMKTAPWIQDKMYEILCANMQFSIANALEKPQELTYKKTCVVLENSWKLIQEERYDDAIEMLSDEHKRAQTCDPSLFYLLAEAYRHRGDSQLTFSMIDRMLECNKNYLPGLVFTAGIAFYQGDLHAAEKGIDHILEREDLFTVIPGFYHNELVLIQGDMLISRGKINMLMPFLRKNILKGRKIRDAEQAKIDDLYDKLKSNEKERLMRFIKRSFKSH